MRFYLALLLAVVALFSVVSGSATNLHASQILIQSTEADELETTQGRLLLRTAAKTDETAENEERGIMDGVKKLSISTVKLPKTAVHWLYVNVKSGVLDIEKTANDFLNRSFNPNQVYRWLRLSDGKQRPERSLWILYAKKYQHAHPKWISKYKYD